MQITCGFPSFLAYVVPVDFHNCSYPAYVVPVDFHDFPITFACSIFVISMPARIHVNVQLVVLVPPFPVSACGPRHPSDSTGTASASTVICIHISLYIHISITTYYTILYSILYNIISNCEDRTCACRLTLCEDRRCAGLRAEPPSLWKSAIIHIMYIYNIHTYFLIFVWDTFSG